jgi:hypothetical protein
MAVFLSMNQVQDAPQIVSASRTRDMVNRSPGLLADILLGRVSCRWGPRAPTGFVDPTRLHTVVLWTKNPENLLHHSGLRKALATLHSEFSVQISLQVTATGLGGSFMEPGIPRWEVLLASLSDLFEEDWIDPAAAVYRYDPFLKVRTPSGKIFGNASITLFDRLCTGFVRLGISRVTTSRADSLRYPAVAKRTQYFDLEWLHLDDRTAAQFCLEMDEVCRSKDLDFSVCCEPLVASLATRWGCIDAKRLNRTRGEQLPGAIETLHNKIGKQRPACRCTYSRDIGYSTGSATCYSGNYGCLYCYSQGNANPPEAEKVRNEIRQFDDDPQDYLKMKNLPPELYRKR